MNVCCSSGRLNETFNFTESLFDKIFLDFDKTRFRYIEKDGYFTIPDLFNEDNIKKNKDIIELETKIDLKKDEIKEYEKKISNLQNKLKNMEKILLIDQKEQQYINELGKNNDE